MCSFHGLVIIQRLAKNVVLRYTNGIMHINTDIEVLLGQILFLAPEEKESIRAKAAHVGPDGIAALTAYLTGALEKQKDIFNRALETDPDYARKFFAFIEQAFDVEKGRFERQEARNTERILDAS